MGWGWISKPAGKELALKLAQFWPGGSRESAQAGRLLVSAVCSEETLDAGFIQSGSSRALHGSPCHSLPASETSGLSEG